MKIWCETCDGTGELDNSTYWEQDTKKCTVCEGKGYTEDKTIEYEAKVGRSAIKAFGVGGWFVIPKSNDAESPRYLIRWAENEEDK